MEMVKEIQCKSILSKSGLADYCLNCYIGCQHACRYCYARFMKEYTKHQEPWGEFVDVKINAVEVLAKELKRKKKGEVFVSSVCDGWQPLEEKYQLTRRCIEALLENGFSLNILTKSALVERDLDLLKSNQDKVELGFTLTCVDEKLKGLFEPLASSPQQRLSVLKKAAKLGIRTYVFFGPLLPGLADKEVDIEELFSSVQDIELDCIYIDRLNLRSGVWPSVSPILQSSYPHLLAKYKMVLFDKKAAQLYSTSLASRVQKVARRYGREEKLRLCF